MYSQQNKLINMIGFLAFHIQLNSLKSELMLVFLTWAIHVTLSN